MTMLRTTRRSPLALAILTLLVEGPLHPYRMQQLIKQRVKDDVVNVRQRASLYQAIERLLRGGLIAVQETERAENRPERTLYRLTDEGMATARQWMCEMLAAPAREFPEFPAALAHLPILSPEEVQEQLERRVELLDEEIADLEARLRMSEAFLPHLFVVESDYLRAMRRAEAAWVRSLIDELRSGRMAWDEAWLREVARRFSPSRPDTPEVEEFSS